MPEKETEYKASDVKSFARIMPLVAHAAWDVSVAEWRVYGEEKQNGCLVTA